MRKKVIHITAHMGGGVGKVLSGICAFSAKNNSKYQHKIIMLEQPEKLNFIDICKKNNVEVLVLSTFKAIKGEIEQADIVQLEWWHHPKFAEFIANFPNIAVNVVVWSHISGCNYPYLPASFLSIPDKFIFTSSYSFDNPFWSKEERSYAQAHCAMVNSSGGFEYISAKEKEHDGFNVGYMGTQSFSKIHPEYVSYCNQIANIPKIKFIMVGDKTNQGAILEQASNMYIAERFEFIDYVSDVSIEFSRFDVFGYILNPQHFGTTENVLLEAMAAGLPVVCLNQCAEQYLIKPNETGLLVNNKKEYADAIEYLYNHPKERKRLGNNAREFVLEKFSVERTVLQLHEIYDSVLLRNKRLCKFDEVFGRKAAEWFLSCLPPNERKMFMMCVPGLCDDDAKGILKELIRFSRCILNDKSKSSVHHFLKVYPQDILLRNWSKLLRD